MRLGRDGIAGLIGLAISLALLPHAFNLPRLPIVPIGPGFYPALVLTFLAATCALLVLQDAIAQRRAPATAPQAPEPRRAYSLVAGAFLVVAAYIALLPLIGFRVATVAFVAAFQLMLERPRTLRQWAILIALAVGASSLAYVAFEKYLSVLLPRGAADAILDYYFSFLTHRIWTGR
jgi:putative tricarboxylic transport membrane protein